MIILPKHFYLKILFFCLTLIPTQIIASEPLFNITNKNDDSNNSKRMRSMHWNAPKPEAPKEEKITRETKSKDKQEKELTDDEKLWNKYKDLVAGTSKDRPKNIDDKDDGKLTKTEQKPVNKQPTGLAAVITDYKNAQKNKSKMSSRSFGKID